MCSFMPQLWSVPVCAISMKVRRFPSTLRWTGAQARLLSRTSNPLNDARTRPLPGRFFSSPSEELATVLRTAEPSGSRQHYLQPLGTPDCAGQQPQLWRHDDRRDAEPLPRLIAPKSGHALDAALWCMHGIVRIAFLLSDRAPIHVHNWKLRNISTTRDRHACNITSQSKCRP